MKKYYYVYEMLWIDDLIKTIELDTLENYDEAVQLAELAQLDINNYNHKYNFDDIAIYIDEIEL